MDEALVPDLCVPALRDESSARRVLQRFTAGAVISVIALVLAKVWPGQVTVGVFLVASAIGGGLAGTSFGRFLAVIGFAVGLLFANVIVLLVLVALEGASAGWGVLVGTTVTFALVFGIAGLVGCALACNGGRFVWAGVKAFTLAGLAGGAVLSLAALTTFSGAGGKPLLLLGTCLGVLLPWHAGPRLLMRVG